MRHGISMKRSDTTIVCQMLLQESFVVSIRILRNILRRKKQYTRDTKRVLKDFLIIDKDAMCKQVRNDSEALYIKEAGKTCPTEILEAIASINAEGRPIWKPMHMQPMYRMHECVGRNGSIRCRTNAYIAGGAEDVGADIFDRGACLPSDNKMTEEQQERIIRVIRSCFE